jgi:hypothetical protein
MFAIGQCRSVKDDRTSEHVRGAYGFSPRLPRRLTIGAHTFIPVSEINVAHEAQYCEPGATVRTHPRPRYNVEHLPSMIPELSRVQSCLG